MSKSKTKRKKCDLCGDDHHASECTTEYCTGCGRQGGACGCEGYHVVTGAKIYGWIDEQMRAKIAYFADQLERNGALAAMATYINNNPGSFPDFMPFVLKYKRHNKPKWRKAD